MADVRSHHTAAGLALHRGRLGDPHDRRIEGIRYHLRHYPRWPRQLERNPEYPAVSDGIRVLRSGIWFGHGGGVLCPDHADQPAVAACAAETGMAMNRRPMTRN